MKVTCPMCQTAYQVMPGKLPASGAAARCPSCGGTILIPGSGAGTQALAKGGPQGSDFERTMAFDFSAVDQGRTEVAGLLKEVGEAAPELAPGFRYALKDAEGRSYPLSKPEILIGRSGVDVNLTDPEVSRRHCRLRIHGDTALLTDQESTNGTHFNGRKILTAWLRPGDRFVIGNTALTFTVEADG